MTDDKRLVMRFEDFTGDSVVFRLYVNLFGVKARIGGFYTDDLRDLLESVADALKTADAWTTEEDAVNKKMHEDDEKRRQRARESRGRKVEGVGFT